LIPFSKENSDSSVSKEKERLYHTFHLKRGGQGTCSSFCWCVRYTRILDDAQESRDHGKRDHPLVSFFLSYFLMNYDREK
jgi:hypothetical protein